MSVNDELRGLLQASKMADPNARAELPRASLASSLTTICGDRQPPMSSMR